MKIVLFLLLLSVSFSAVATPEIKGTPGEIGQYLNGIPKIITINAQADQLVSSKKARIKLSIETEAKTLADALRQNRSIRQTIRKKLLALSINPDQINESRFSSTPEYGFFGDLPKSYTVNNTLSVRVDSEQKMIAVAQIADTTRQARYISSTPEIEDKEAVYTALSQKALQKAKQKAELYQQQLGIKLVPVFVNEEKAGQMPRPQIAQKRRFDKSMGSTSYFEADSKAVASFGETRLSVIATIQYKVYPPQ